MNIQSEMSMNGYIGNVDNILDEPQDYTASLYEVVEKFRNKIWLCPSHQRDFVWEPDKVRAWMDRLALATQERHRKPVGVIVTYQIANGSPSATFINDGSQRIRASLQVLDDPVSYGYDQEAAEKIVRAFRIPIQHRWYRNPDEALEDFQFLNMGTSLTSREMCKGILSNHSRYETIWLPLFMRVHDRISHSGLDILTKVKPNRIQQHKFERSDFATIVAWLDKGRELPHFEKIGSSELRKDQLNSSVVERMLRSRCDTLSAEQLNQEINLLLSHIDRTTATCRAAWRKAGFADGDAISLTTFRWILLISVWVRNTNKSNALWEDFLTKLFVNTQGTSVVQASVARDRVVLGLGMGKKLWRVCRILESPLYEETERRKRSRIGRVAGYDDSHVHPFVTNGNGVTIPEPASRNRARGARPIDKADDRLDEIIDTEDI